MPPSVLIVGGGAAGLTAAYELASSGTRVTLLEPSASLGGRCSSTEWTGRPIWLHGCDRSTRSLLSDLHHDCGRLLRPVHYEFFGADGSIRRVPRPWLPAPLHTGVSLLSCRALPWRDRWRLLSWLERIWEGAESPATDLGNRYAEDWLRTIGQSEEARRAVWDPLAMWLTGNRLTGLSAGAWLSAMRRPFLGSRSDAKLDLVASSFRDWFVEPIARRLEKADADVRTGVEAVQMLIGKDAVAGIRLTDGSTIHADWYIMAVPHHRLPGLLPERLLTRYAYFQHITELRDVPAVTVRIMLEGHRAGPGLILCGGGPFHSVEVATADQETMIVLTAYADETSMSRPDEELARSALEQARAFVPAAQSGHRSTTITRHPAAFLALCPGTRALRPIHQSPLRNLLVAGAWTDTGRPPNLESAVMSGSRCAGIISTRS